MAILNKLIWMENCSLAGLNLHPLQIASPNPNISFHEIVKRLVLQSFWDILIHTHTRCFELKNQITLFPLFWMEPLKSYFFHIYVHLYPPLLKFNYFSFGKNFKRKRKGINIDLRKEEGEFIYKKNNIIGNIHNLWILLIVSSID